MPFITPDGSALAGAAGVAGAGSGSVGAGRVSFGASGFDGFVPGSGGVVAGVVTGFGALGSGPGHAVNISNAATQATRAGKSIICRA
jgi:hypothetical protein